EGPPPWRANAVAFHAPAGRPMVAVVIDDMGLDRKRSARTVKLPGPLTLSWLPYADDLPAQTAAAKAAGHELMLHLPMEPSIRVNPGPDALLTSLSVDENLRRLDRALGRFSGFVGVNNHMGSRFTADRAALRPIIAEINRRGYLWYDSRTAPASVGMALAAEIGAPWAGRDVFLDHVMTAGEVAKALARLETLAKQHGVATAIGHPHDVTIDALTRWLPELPKRGLTLVPLSAVVAAKQSSSHTLKNGDVK
ncbi:MAG TPA: divergent polysaccharide deacetylase family protein, partial [Azospirillaceae bacterium]|nr:divergent polysaccharide deacetylase family protein [Azospirillaceae bacterium]